MKRKTKALPRLTETQIKAIALLWDSVAGTEDTLILEASVAMGWAFEEGHPLYEVPRYSPRRRPGDSNKVLAF